MCCAGIVGIWMALAGWFLLKDKNSIGLVNVFGFFMIVASVMFIGLGIVGLADLLGKYEIYQ
jgi:hypothetical protein